MQRKPQLPSHADRHVKRVYPILLEVVFQFQNIVGQQYPQGLFHQTQVRLPGQSVLFRQYFLRLGK